MTRPDHVPVFETPLGIYWFDEDRVLCSVSNNATRTLPKVKEEMRFLEDLLKGEKMCGLIDLSNVGSVDPDARDYANRHLPKIYRAIGIISSTDWGRVICNFYFQLRKPSFPMKMFKDDKPAKAWVLQYHTRS